MLILEISPTMWYLEIKPPMLNSISMNLYVEFHGGIRNFHFHRSNSRELSYIDGNEIVNIVISMIVSFSPGKNYG